MASVRDQGKFRASQKEIWVLVRDTFLLGSGVESPLIFYTKKKIKYKLHVQNTSNVID